jgi:hypothetical protein
VPDQLEHGQRNMVQRVWTGDPSVPDTGQNKKAVCEAKTSLFGQVQGALWPWLPTRG